MAAGTYGTTITTGKWTGIGVDPSIAVDKATDATLSASVSDILGLQEKAITNTAAATAATTQAAGYTAESGAYGTAADIATQNAVLAGVSGSIKELQQARTTTKTVGEQQAQVAAAGFGASGSSLDILRDSLQQGYLTQQLTQSQTQITQGGYLEEAAASMGQKAAADVTSKAATALSTSYTAASTSATSNAAAATSALNDFLSTKTLTSAQKLTLAPLSGTIDTTALKTAVPAVTKPIVWGNTFW